MLGLIILLFVLAVACFATSVVVQEPPSSDAVVSRRVGWVFIGIVLVVAGVGLIRPYQEATWSDAEVRDAVREAAKALHGSRSAFPSVEDAVRDASRGRGEYDQLEIRKGVGGWTVSKSDGGASQCLTLDVLGESSDFPRSGRQVSATASEGRCAAGE